MLAVLAKLIIGRSSIENLDSEGCSASSGKSEIIPFIFRCASWRAKSTFASVVSSTVTIETDSKEVELIDSTFSIEESTSSIFSDTDVFTSLGAAPG